MRRGLRPRRPRPRQGCEAAAPEGYSGRRLRLPREKANIKFGSISGRRATDAEPYGSGAQRAATVTSGTGALSSATPMEISGNAELAAWLQVEEFAEAAEAPPTGGASSSASGSAPPPPTTAATAAASPSKRLRPHHPEFGVKPRPRTTAPVVRFLEPEQESKEKPS